MRRGARVGGVGAGEVEVAHLAQPFRRQQRVAPGEPPVAGARQRQVDPRAEGDERRRRHPLGEQPGEQREGEPAAGAVAAERDPPGRPALGDERVPGGAGVVERRRKGVLGRQPVVRQRRPDPGARRQRRDQRRVRAVRAEAVGAAVQPEQHAAPGRRRDPHRRPAGERRLRHREPARQRHQPRHPLHPRPGGDDRARPRQPRLLAQAQVEVERDQPRRHQAPGLMRTPCECFGPAAPRAILR